MRLRRLPRFSREGEQHRLALSRGGFIRAIGVRYGQPTIRFAANKLRPKSPGMSEMLKLPQCRSRVASPATIARTSWNYLTTRTGPNSIYRSFWPDLLRAHCTNGWSGLRPSVGKSDSCGSSAPDSAGLVTERSDGAPEVR